MLIPEQEEVGKLLNQVPEFWPRVRVRCARCNETVGLVLDTIVRKDEETYVTQLGAVWRAQRFTARMPGKRLDPSPYGIKVGRLSNVGLYHALIEHSTAARLPDLLPVACDRHGDRPGINRLHLLGPLAVSRETGTLAPKVLRT